MNSIFRCVIASLLFPSSALAGGWMLERKTSPATGETATMLSLTTEDMHVTNAPDAPRSAQLFVQCWQSTVSLVVAFPTSLTSRSNLSVRLAYRIGEEATDPAPAGVSGNGRATGWWKTAAAMPVIEKMKRESELTLTVEGDRAAKARFGLAGFAEAVEPVLAACGQ